MKAICVDDEPLILDLVVSMCRKLPQITDAQGFTAPGTALKWLDGNRVDLALLDIDMPGVSGITLARMIKEKWPDAAIIFLTGYSQYAVEAFALHASGYLLKPVSEKRLAAEVQYALERKTQKQPYVPAAILAYTFGPFELYVNGDPVSFERARAKELLALLVDQRGGSMTQPEIFAALWEDALYDRSAQKQLDVIIRSLKKTLAQYHVEQIVEMRSGTLRIVPQELECDMYRLLAGDVDAVNAYRGEYMSNYSWARMTEGYLDERLKR